MTEKALSGTGRRLLQRPSDDTVSANMNKMETYQRILRDTVAPEMETDDVLWRGLVLHTHEIVLRADLQLDDVRPAPGERRVLCGLTRNSVADLLASLGLPGEKSARAAFWWGRANSVTPYELFSEVPEAFRARADAAKQAIAAHPFVDELIED